MVDEGEKGSCVDVVGWEWGGGRDVCSGSDGGCLLIRFVKLLHRPFITSLSNLLPFFFTFLLSPLSPSLSSPPFSPFSFRLFLFLSFLFSTPRLFLTSLFLLACVPLTLRGGFVSVELLRSLSSSLLDEETSFLWVLSLQHGCRLLIKEDSSFFPAIFFIQDFPL